MYVRMYVRMYVCTCMLQAMLQACLALLAYGSGYLMSLWMKLMTGGGFCLMPPPESPTLGLLHRLPRSCKQPGTHPGGRALWNYVGVFLWGTSGNMHATYVHTYIHACMHTDRQADRQTYIHINIYLEREGDGKCVDTSIKIHACVHIQNT